jgi:hypothetical protein
LCDAEYGVLADPHLDIFLIAPISTIQKPMRAFGAHFFSIGLILHLMIR